MTIDDKLRNLELAFNRATHDKEVARHDAESYRTAAGILWQTVKAAYDEYLEYESLSEATLDQMLVSLEWTPEPAQEGAAE
jgi:hypothetical protein